MPSQPPIPRLTRRSLLAGMGGMAAATLASCGGNESPTGAGDPGEGTSEGDGPLRFLLVGPPPELQDLVENELIPAFAQEEGVDVELQTSDWGSAFQKVTTAAATGTLPDVLTVGGIWTAPLVASGALLDLTDYVDAWADRDQYYTSMIEDASYQGSVYAVPIYADVRTVIYRADMFEQAGLDPEAPPTTWEEYRSAAERLVVRDGDDITVQGVDWGQDTSIGLQQVFAQLLFQAGGTYYDEGGSAQFASPEGRRALEYMVSFFEDGLSSANFVNAEGNSEPLVKGTAAMQLWHSGILEYARVNNKAVVEDIKAGLPLKIAPEAEPVTSAWINKFGVGASTSQPEAAWRFLAFLSERANLEEISESYGLVPPRKDLAQADYLDGIDSDFIEAANYVVPQPPHVDMLQIAQVINGQIERAIRLEAGVDEVLEAIDSEVDSITGA